MGHFYLAELDDTPKSGRVRKFKNQADARAWGKEELEIKKDSCGPCEIFKINDRTDKVEFVLRIRRAGDVLEESIPPKSERTISGDRG